MVMYVRDLAHIFGISLVTDDDINFIEKIRHYSLNLLLGKPDFAPDNLNFSILLVKILGIGVTEIMEHLLYSLMSIDKLIILLGLLKHVVQIFLNQFHSFVHCFLEDIRFVRLRIQRV